MFMVIEMEILKRKSMEQLIDELGPNDINFMKDLLKDLAKLDLFERVELDKEDDLEDNSYVYYDMNQKIEDEVKYRNNQKAEAKKRTRKNK
jgi:hypothetical protein